MKNMAVVAFDLETTGLNPAAARIVSFAAKAVYGEAWMTRLINPGCSIPGAARKVHGVSDADVVDMPTFADAAPELMEPLEIAYVVTGYNIKKYDIPLFNAELHRADISAPSLFMRVIDVFTFASWHYRHLRSRKLADVCKHVGIDAGNSHTAIDDAIATAKMFSNFIDAGVIPPTFDEAQAEQTRIEEALVEEREAWSYWLYRDRVDPDVIRMGCGKHCGMKLHLVDRRYLRYILGIVDDMPQEARRLIDDAVR